MTTEFFADFLLSVLPAERRSADFSVGPFADDGIAGGGGAGGATIFFSSR